MAESGKPVLRINDLQKAFTAPSGDARLVVHVNDFSLAEGEQVAVRGESGSGKTTFLHLISGILAADAGEIAIAGQRLTALSEHGRDRLRAESVGYIFQTFNLLQGYSVLENVVLGMSFAGRRDRERAVQLLTRVGLQDRLDYRPKQLSTGQQQRAAVARALAKNPRLVLADEPTGNLDRRNAREALALIRETCREQGAALLLVSHDPSVLEKFDRAVEFADLNLAARKSAP